MKEILKDYLAVFAIAFFGALMLAQYKKDEAQDRRMEEWMSNTAATLEGMEYDMSRLMSTKQDTTYGK